MVTFHRYAGHIVLLVINLAISTAAHSGVEHYASRAEAFNGEKRNRTWLSCRQHEAFRKRLFRHSRARRCRCQCLRVLPLARARYPAPKSLALLLSSPVARAVSSRRSFRATPTIPRIQCVPRRARPLCSIKNLAVGGKLLYARPLFHNHGVV